MRQPSPFAQKCGCAGGLPIPLKALPDPRLLWEAPKARQGRQACSTSRDHADLAELQACEWVAPVPSRGPRQAPGTGLARPGGLSGPLLPEGCR